jgi:hypothetical protein
MSKEYKYSGRVDWNRTILWFVIGMLCSEFIGVGHGILSYINPLESNYNILDVLNIATTVFALGSYVLIFVTKQTYARNRGVLIAMTAIMACFRGTVGGVCF